MVEAKSAAAALCAVGLSCLSQIGEGMQRLRSIRIGAGRLTIGDSPISGRSLMVNSTRHQVNFARQTSELCRRHSPKRAMGNQGVTKVIPRTLHAQRYPKILRKLSIVIRWQSSPDAGNRARKVHQDKAGRTGRHDSTNGCCQRWDLTSSPQPTEQSINSLRQKAGRARRILRPSQPASQDGMHQSTS